MVAVWLTVRQNPWCWPIGIVNVSCYAWLFFGTRLYADAALQVVYIGLCAYGWWAWQHGGPGRRELAVARTPAKQAFVLFALGVVATCGIGVALWRFTDADLPFWDAGTTSFSLVAQALQTRKRIENWLVWIVVDVVYVGIYLVKGLRLTAGLYVLFTVLAVAGWLSWRRTLAAQPAVA